MNEHAEKALSQAREVLGEHFSEFLIVAAFERSREPIIEKSGSVFAAKGLADAAAYQLDVLGKCDDDEDDGERKWRDDGDDFTDGDPKVKA